MPKPDVEASGRSSPESVASVELTGIVAPNEDSNRGGQSPSVSSDSFNDGVPNGAGLVHQYRPLESACRADIESRGDCCNPRQKAKLEMGLIHSSLERVRLKDFNSEIRAAMDVEQFLHQAELILDMSEVSVEDIVDSMLMKALANDQEPGGLSEAREAIFVKGSTMLLAQTIQGVGALVELGKPAEPADLEYDQSWMCAMCNLGQISGRHMVVARFKQPVNMGENAHEIRLFVLILTPSKEKGTKNALETGRTFATMLTDSTFRQRLLEAKTETEFKSYMMLKAQQLAKAKSLKNRHKYMLDAAVQLSIYSLDPRSQADNKPKRTLVDNHNDSVCNSANLFNKNPRTSKLFELIVSPGERAEQSACDKLATKQVLDTSHLANYKKASNSFQFGVGLCNDLKRRLGYYFSDFKDAFVGPPKTLQKTVATIWFLYFGILLPTIAFSALNTSQTHGHMGDLRKALIGQAIGGLGFALMGGQPLVIIMTTAPLCLYTKVIHQMCIDYGFHFPAMYAAVGLWNGFFLTIYSLFGFSRLMQWCTRSTEEIFALFIVVAFITDACKDLTKNFNKFYYAPACTAISQTLNSTSLMEGRTVGGLMDSLNTTVSGNLAEPICRRDTSLLFVLLMLGTLWLAVTLYRFNKTPYLDSTFRDLLADYALPTAVIAMSFLGSFVFDDVYVEKFPPLKDIQFDRAQVELLPWTGVLTAMGLGFTLSLLFFMDQNISAAMVNAPQNKLKKGCAYHYDLLVVGLLNGALSLYGLPMMHGVLPHSPLHVRSLADIEQRVEEGHLREIIVNVRETRVTAVVSHVLLLASLLLIPYPIAYIPTAVLNGLFLYMAVTSLDGLQMFERILLLFTEQSKYPPNHYIRRCPQRKIHTFTLIQLLQLGVMCLFGFSPINIVEMFFPVIILLMIPFRHKFVPKYIDDKYLDALDGKH